MSLRVSRTKADKAGCTSVVPQPTPCGASLGSELARARAAAPGHIVLPERSCCLERIKSLEPNLAREKGNKAFKEGKYDKAIRHWQGAAALREHVKRARPPLGVPVRAGASLRVQRRGRTPRSRYATGRRRSLPRCDVRWYPRLVHWYCMEHHGVTP